LSRHLRIVANGFRAVGLLLGIPSLLVCLCLTALKIDLARSKPVPSAQSGSDVNLKRDGIVGVVEVVATVIVKSLELVGKGVDWIAGILAIVAAALTLAGASLFLTGRGLVLHAAWARIAAGLAASGFLLISFLVMTALRRGAVFALIPIAVSIYMLWVLIRRFNQVRQS
jgi:hypothetical protein